MDTTFLLNNVLKSDGTNQNQRLLNALDPDFIKVDERTIKDILSFTYNLSKQINYFNINDVVESDWSSFLNFFVDPVTDDIVLSNDDIAAIINRKNDFDPHFALLLTFISLFSHLQTDINTISKRRLDFYLNKILQLLQKPPVSDKVNLVLELSKNLSDHLLPAGTQFKAKSPDGKTLIYQSDNEIVINNAQIISLKSLFVDANDNYKIYTASVANSANGIGKPFTGTNVKWHAFGESQLNKTDNERNMQLTDIGFAFASPMLLLQEGERTIVLSIILSDLDVSFSKTDITNSIIVSVSGEKGWITPKLFSAIFVRNSLNPSIVTLSVSCTLASTDDSVIAFDKTLLAGNFITLWPVLKIVLKPEAGIYNDLYNLQIISSNISVTVNGIKSFVAQNDQSSLDTTKPFLPFGSTPAINSAFYLGNAEVYQKKLSNFSLDVLWNSVPQADLIDYYKAYQNGNPQTNLEFTARISLLYEDRWLQFLRFVGGVYSGDYYLFSDDATQSNHIEITPSDFNKAVSQATGGYIRNTDLQQVTSFDNKTHDGFIKLELSGPLASTTGLNAFGHSQYADLYTKAAIKLATDASVTLPNAPYTPSIKSLALNYTSVQSVNFTDENSADQFFHIGPFGTAPNLNELLYLLPQFRNESLLPQFKKDTQLYLGNFFIGLANLVPPQNVSFLFQVAEGSANDDTDAIITDDDIQWSYLSNNEWKLLDKLNIITNTTRGLQTPGIISFAISSDITSDNTLMPAGSYWLRASTQKKPAGISELIDIRTQAVEATFVNVINSDINSSHADMLLPAGASTELVIKDAAVKSVQQPYQSFNGQPQESGNTFYARVSERLRHKKRALSLWDYERIILDQFPEIFKVKCLTHTDENSDLQPGTVSAVVVPNLINKNSLNPLEPRVNLITLLEIESYMADYLPAFVEFKVTNPVYEQLLIDCKVGFREGKDAGYYGNLLNEEIKEFLSPWAYETGEDITFGGRVFKSDILYFIENRSYVDFVNDFKLYHIFNGVDANGPGIGKMSIGIDFIIYELIPPGVDEMTIGSDFIIGADTEVAIASLPQSILVSANDHRLTVLNSGDYQCPGVEYGGIGFMSVGLNFIVE
jgi:hypothetical protein